MTYYLAPALVQLRNEVNAAWPGRSKVSDGWIGDTAHQARRSDHNPARPPDVSPGVVRAFDFTAAGIDVARLLDVVLADPRTAYVIWNRRIWENPAAYPGRGYWRAYSGANPHDKHVHISVRHARAHDHDGRAWMTRQVVNPVSPPASTARPPSVDTAPVKPINPLGDDMSEARIHRSDGAIFYVRIDSHGGSFRKLDEVANLAVDRMGIAITKHNASPREVGEIRQAVIDLSQHKIDPA